MSKKGFSPPNHTQTPNEFYDSIMREIDTLAEMKVTSAIIRQTFGWHVEERELSLGDLEKLTGLTRASVSDGIKRALERGTVSRREVGNTYAYKLVVEEVDQYRISTTDSIESKPPDSIDAKPKTVQNLNHSEHPIKEKKKRTTKENNNKQTAVADPDAEKLVELFTLIETAGKGKPTYEALSKWLATYGYDRVRECVEWYVKGVELGEVNVVGWLVTCLKESYSEPSWLNGRKEKESTVLRPDTDFDELSRRYAARGFNVVGYSNDDDEPPPESTKPGEMIWRAARIALSRTLAPETHASLIKPLTFLGLDGNTFRLGTNDESTCNWLEERLRDDILAALGLAAEDKTVDVEFVLIEPMGEEPAYDEPA